MQKERAQARVVNANPEIDLLSQTSARVATAIIARVITRYGDFLVRLRGVDLYAFSSQDGHDTMFGTRGGVVSLVDRDLHLATLLSSDRQRREYRVVCADGFGLERDRPGISKQYSPLHLQAEPLSGSKVTEVVGCTLPSAKDGAGVGPREREVQASIAEIRIGDDRRAIRNERLKVKWVRGDPYVDLIRAQAFGGLDILPTCVAKTLAGKEHLYGHAMARGKDECVNNRRVWLKRVCREINNVRARDVAKHSAEGGKRRRRRFELAE